MSSTDLQDLAVTYAAALDDLPILAYLARPDGAIAYVSARWNAVFGIAAGEVGGEVYPTLVHPEQRAAARATWTAACAAGITYRDELLLRLADGTDRWYLSEAKPVRDAAQAAVTGWFGTLTDIDESRRARETLRAQAEFNERLIDSSDDCIKILDLEARLVSMSANGQQTLRIFNFDALVGSSWLEFWHGADRVAAQAAVDAARAGGTGRFTGYFPVGDEPRWFDVVVTAILDAQGRPEKLLGVSRDITAMRRTTQALVESEQRYRAFSEALPGMTWSAGPDGGIEYVPERWSETRGQESHNALGDGWLHFVHPDDRDATRERWQRSVSTGEQYDTQFRVAMADGSHRWQLVRALPIRDGAGAISRWIGVNIDIDDQHRADAARDMFVSLAENSKDYIAIGDLDGKTVYINEAGRRLLHISADHDLSATRLPDYLYRDDLEHYRLGMKPALERDGHWAGDVRLRNFRTDAPVPIGYTIFELRDSSGTVRGTAALGRDRRRRDRIEAGLQLLSRAGAATLDLLDYATTLRNIAHAFVPAFASYCVIDIRAAAGWERTVVHRDTLKESLIAGLDVPAGRHPIALAFERGECFLFSLDDAWPLEFDDRSAVIDALGVRSFITVPVVMPTGAIVGGLTAARDISFGGANYDAEDLAFVQEAGRRVGAAIANARLYERERRIAVELQAASLPATLPLVDHLHLNAEYRPGSDEATIGGDWYDAFILEDGRVAITLGDVLGHGLHAAVTMTKLRQAMQSAAMIDPDPNVMLRVADKTLRLLDPDRYATAIAAIYNAERHTLTFASAGHAGPIVRTPDGRIEEFSSPGSMLGLRSGDETEMAVVPTPPGTSMVLFTDGLVEATRDLTAGYARLHAAIARDSVIYSAQPARAIVDEILGSLSASDDIAVLVLRTGPSSDPPASPERQSTYRDANAVIDLTAGALDASSGEIC